MSNISMSGYLRGDNSNRRRAERRHRHLHLHVCVWSQRQHGGDAAAEERGQVAERGHQKPLENNKRGGTFLTFYRLFGGRQV